VDPRALDYALLDFGAGRRLDRFGTVIVDRPAPGALDVDLLEPAAWTAAQARFGRASEADQEAAWDPPDALPPAWQVEIDGLRLELHATPAGQVGLFPEHAEPARWAAECAGLASARLGRQVEVLNLFAYTGLATLALARAGARVAHVDAARPAVAWARRNATLAGLEHAPVRWIVEDARTFVAREARRKRRYDAVLLDPPSYGHGPRRGSAWHMEMNLPELLAGCAALTGPAPAFFMLTGHRTGLTAADLLSGIADAYGGSTARAAAAVKLGQCRPDGLLLPAGLAVRWGP
jgi:23S rRNA (cytosine1962-C5)-methyltransferase